MAQYTVTRVTAWEQVEEASAITKKCIRPDSVNWQRAKETWETLGDQVLYFIVKQATYPYGIEGYVRLFNTSSKAYQNNPTWVVDFMWPASAEVVVRITDVLPGNVLVKPFFGDDVAARKWPKVALALMVPKAPYRITTQKETDWLLVI